MELGLNREQNYNRVAETRRWVGRVGPDKPRVAVMTLGP